MKNVDKYLNSLQLTHKINPNGCCGNKCALPGCGNCLCNLRSDAIYCCGCHRSEANNKKYNVEHAHYIENVKKNKENQSIMIDLYKRDFRMVDRTALDIAGVDFKAFPATIFLNGKMMAGFGPIGVWMDQNKMFHLEKIKNDTEWKF